MFNSPAKALAPQVVTRIQMKVLNANTLHSSIRAFVHRQGVCLSICGVREDGPGQYVPVTPSQIVPDEDVSLDSFAVPECDLYLVEGIYQPTKPNPAEKLTRAEFLVELLDRIEGLGRTLQYYPALYENVAPELEIAQHYARGAFSVEELCGDIEHIATLEDTRAPA